MPDLKTWHNTRVMGKKKSMVENSGMISVLTTESFTPIIEVDILGPDSHELLGFTEDRFQQMPTGEPSITSIPSLSDMLHQVGSHLYEPYSEQYYIYKNIHVYNTIYMNACSPNAKAQAC